MNIVPLTEEELETINEVVYANEDLVNAPKHYQSEAGMECWEAQLAATGVAGYVAHCRATAIKYCWRAGEKDAGAEAQDLRKAAWYLNKAAEVLDGHSDTHSN